MGMIRTAKIARRWSDQDTATLRRMYRAGFSNNEIAKALGRTVPSIMQKLAMMKRRERLFSN